MPRIASGGIVDLSGRMPAMLSAAKHPTARCRTPSALADGTQLIRLTGSKAAGRRASLDLAESPPLPRAAVVSTCPGLTAT